MFYFYDHLHVLSFIIVLFIHKNAAVVNSELVIVKKGLDPIQPCAVGMKFFVTVNNTSNLNDYDIEFNPDRCCIDVAPHDQDCNVVELYGVKENAITRGTVATVKLIAPIVNPLDKRGSCLIYLDSKDVNDGISMRNPIKIDFNTNARKRRFSFGLGDTKCPSVDQDPTQNCAPVDCDRVYNGRRSYYDENLKRCVAAPNCVSSNPASDLPDVIYNPMINECVSYAAPITENDIDALKSLHRHPKDILIIKNVQRPPEGAKKKEQNKCNCAGKATGGTSGKSGQKEQPKSKSKSNSKSESKSDQKTESRLVKFFNYLVHNKCTINILITVVVLQCCFVTFLGYCMSNTKECHTRRKKRYTCHEAKLTTPLICTSNVETDTTDFVSECSNNAFHKIKYYKSMQKPEAQQMNNIQKCLSDDILSKCIARRDWKSRVVPTTELTEADASPQYNPSNTIEECLGSENDSADYNSTNYTQADSNKPNNQDVRVNFKNEVYKKAIQTIVNPKAKRLDRSSSKAKRKEFASKETSSTGIDDEPEAPSEKEIECHSYSKTASDKQKLSGSINVAYTISELDAKKHQDDESKLAENSAQTYFSNDSIDDYLSESGMVLLTGENISKYSFNSVNCDSRNSSGTSNKKPKINIFKNVLSSILHKRSKNGPSSDPGSKNTTSLHDNVDVELIHMSNASVFSSSNEIDSNDLEPLTKNNDKVSRTSF